MASRRIYRAEPLFRTDFRCRSPWNRRKPVLYPREIHYPYHLQSAAKRLRILLWPKSQPKKPNKCEAQTQWQWKRRSRRVNSRRRNRRSWSQRRWWWLATPPQPNQSPKRLKFHHSIPTCRKKRKSKRRNWSCHRYLRIPSSHLPETVVIRKEITCSFKESDCSRPRSRIRKRLISNISSLVRINCRWTTHFPKTAKT